MTWLAETLGPDKFSSPKHPAIKGIAYWLQDAQTLYLRNDNPYRVMGRAERRCDGEVEGAEQTPSDSSQSSPPTNWPTAVRSAILVARHMFFNDWLSRRCLYTPEQIAVVDAVEGRR